MTSSGISLGPEAQWIPVQCSEFRRFDGSTEPLATRLAGVFCSISFLRFRWLFVSQPHLSRRESYEAFLHQDASATTASDHQPATTSHQPNRKQNQFTKRSVCGRIADETFQSSIMSSLLLSKVEPLRGGTQCRESRRFSFFILQAWFGRKSCRTNLMPSLPRFSFIHP